MKHFVLTAGFGLLLCACGAADGMSVGEEGNTASDEQGLVNQWTPFISEEAPAFTTCGSDNGVAATAARCTGSYCDNMSLFCGTSPFTTTGQPDSLVWTTYVSEEQPAGVMCPSWGILPRVIDGIAATGSYADNIAVRCRGAVLGPDVNCGWTPYFSEEQGIQTFRYNIWSYQTAVAKGVRCSGSYCDNLSFYVCEPKCTSNSQCFGACVNGVCTVG